MRKFKWLLTFTAVLWLSSVCAAQASIDVGFGLGTTIGSKSNPLATNGVSQGLNGGIFPVISGDAIFFRNLGFGAEVAWRATRGDYQGIVPYRPMFWDINAVYSPRFARIAPELQAGIGAQSTRFYTGQITCNGVSCQNFVSSNKFMGHFSAGLKLYVSHSFFLRPEAHLYLIANNQDYATGKAGRVGLTVGYTFGR